MRGIRIAALKLLALPACMLGAGLAAAQEAPSPAQAAPAPAQAAPASAAAPSAAGNALLPSILFVLESGRSMGGKLGDTPKLDIARTGIEQALTNQAGRAAFGVITFGHRKTWSCKDTELLAKPGALTGESYETLLGGLKPKGRQAAIAAAVSDAASLASTGEPLDVILVADGKDECKADVCKTADVLKQASKGLRVHVVGLNEKAEALDPLACIAEKTGGKFVAATSGAAFRDGLDAVLASITNPPVPLDAVKTAEGPPLKPGETAVFKSGAQRTLSVSPPKTNEPQQPVPVSFKALVTEGGAQLRSGLTWRVYSAKRTADGSFELISTHREPAPTAALLPGEYLVNAAYGLSNLTKKLKVDGGQSLNETFVLNTGALALRGVLANGQECPDGSVRFDILSDEADQFGKHEAVLADAKPRSIIRLNAGVYRIRSLYGDANAVVGVDVTVEPGKVTQATLKHSGAKITFRLVQSLGGEALADTKWTILTSAGDTVKSNAGALPTHILAAGNYAVVADHAGNSYTRKFSIEPGGDRQIEVAIADGPTSEEELKILLNPPDAPEPGTGIAAGEGPGNAMGFDGFSRRPADPNAPLINPGTLFRPSSP
jgi:hypothetical protein